MGPPDEPGQAPPHPSRGVTLLGLAVGFSLLLACGTSPSGSGLGLVHSINGRVVDFQSCFSTSGCQPVSGMRVGLFEDPQHLSATTDADGAFVLDNVASGAVVHLVVTGASQSSTYLTTLQAKTIVVEGQDLFGVEAFTLSGNSQFYQAMAAELAESPDLTSHGIYLGQVLRRGTEQLEAYEGAAVRISPAANVRFVKNHPDLDPAASGAFYEASWSATGGFGQFVAWSGASGTEFLIAPDAEGTEFEPALVALSAGYLTIGMHRALEEEGSS